MIYAFIMSILLTPRWFEYPTVVVDHQVQTNLKQSILAKTYSNIIIAAGRRSFKTERFLKRFFVSESIKNDGEINYLGAPTRMQAKEIFWADVKKLSPKHQVDRVMETELKIQYKSGSVLHVVGLDAFKRVQGGMAHMVGLTEFQDCDPAVYSESFEPMLNDTNGLFIGEGRPLGKNHLYDYYLKGINGEPGWGAFHWKSSEILTEEQIARAKSNLTEADYLREYDASFETAFGNPYHAFDENLNVRHRDIDPKLPILVACDFNATEKPMSWVIGQRVNEGGNDVTYWCKVFSQQFTHTKMMCEIVDEYFQTFPTYPSFLYFYGDYAGNRHESNSSLSDWQIIEKHFSKTGFKKNVKPCKSIRNSIAATNGRFINANGIRRQFVDKESCKPLIADWQKCQWKANSRELDETDPLRGHCCRAVDYYNDYEYPIQTTGVRILTN